jgi:hypothetical protein
MHAVKAEMGHHGGGVDGGASACRWIRHVVPKKNFGGGGVGAGWVHTAQAERQHDCVRMMLACWELVVVGH